MKNIFYSYFVSVDSIKIKLVSTNLNITLVPFSKITSARLIFSVLLPRFDQAMQCSLGII